MESNRLTNIDQAVHYMRGQRDKLVEQLNQCNAQLDRHQHEVEVLTGIRKLLEVLGKTGEATTKNFIEPLVTEALNFVYGYDLKFNLEFVTRRNQTEIDFFFTNKDGTRGEGDPEDTYGGGILDVVSMVLRIGVSHVLKIEGPIFLDEPGKFVDEPHNSRLGLLTHELSHKFNKQIVVITHSTQFAGYGDKVYTVTQLDGISRVIEGVQ